MIIMIRIPYNQVLNVENENNKLSWNNFIFEMCARVGTN